MPDHQSGVLWRCCSELEGVALANVSAELIHALGSVLIFLIMLSVLDSVKDAYI